MEKPILPLPRNPFAHFTSLHAVNAVVAFLFASSGPVAIILAVGARGGLSESDLASWIFAAFVVNGLVGIVCTLLYRMPLAYGWTIPGTVLIGPALGHLSVSQVIGAYLATGVLMLVLGLTGWVRRAMDAVPLPIVMAMVAGVFLRFGIDLVLAFKSNVWIAASMTIAFLVVSSQPRVARLLPPLIVALVIGAIAVWALGEFKTPAGTLFAFARPKFIAPEFSWMAMVELVVPLAITVLVVQNGQGVAALTANGHQPPTNAIAVACGIGSLITATMGSVSSCLTGPVNAILSSAGEKQHHYVAALIFCTLMIGFGLLAPLFTRLMLATPPAFIAVLAGLAMLRVLQTAFQVAFRDKFSLGALVCFLVTVADVSILNIGAAFWGLVIGLAISRVLERADFPVNTRTL